MDKNNFALGLFLGAVTPIIGFYLVQFVFELLIDMGVMGMASMDLHSQRMRTILLLALCCNLIPFNVLKNYKWDRTMQGMVFPTLFYAGAWVWQYGKTLI